MKKLQATNSDNESNLEDIADILAQKDEKIEDLIVETGIQDDLREELEQVKRKLITLQDQAYKDTEN